MRNSGQTLGPAIYHQKAGVRDAELLAVLNAQLIEDEGHWNTMNHGELTIRIRTWLTTGRYEAMLFRDREGGEPVAYALYQCSPQEVFLRHFFVARDRRRQGIGRQAMRILMEEVWPRGLRMTVEALAQNESALAFWRALGYADYSIKLEIPAR